MNMRGEPLGKPVRPNSPSDEQEPRCPEGDTPHPPHWWIDRPPVLAEYGGLLHLLTVSSLGNTSRHCPGYAGDPPYNAEPVSYQDILNQMKSVRTPWAPKCFKTNSDRVAFDRLMELAKKPEQGPNYLLSGAPGSLTGIPIIFDDAIPSGMMVFVDQAGKLVMLDFREDGEKQSGD